MTDTFRAIWPITDLGASWHHLITAATPEVQPLALRAHATITAPGRFYVAESKDIPGSGRTTLNVLVYEAPAVPMKPRSYWTNTQVSRASRTPVRERMEAARPEVCNHPEPGLAPVLSQPERRLTAS